MEIGLGRPKGVDPGVALGTDVRLKGHDITSKLTPDLWQGFAPDHGGDPFRLKRCLKLLAKIWRTITNINKVDRNAKACQKVDFKIPPPPLRAKHKRFLDRPQLDIQDHPLTSQGEHRTPSSVRHICSRAPAYKSTRGKPRQLRNKPTP
ncbi:hypothetical protein AVEN_10453-1 [Araneus ventricosus]|uniref:Uncharacterized protein n=1 Tax=Araneus ventricosus TaxID=182803 RepID=A0A4Y2N4Y3_ARAVE|nr:hypothetical protein AVEN_10453-1 [Araneus ventricosus]